MPSRIPFVVSLSNHGRYRPRPPTSFDSFRDHDKDANAFPDTVRGEPVEPWTVSASAAHILRQVQGERPSYRQGRQRECCRRSSESTASKPGYGAGTAEAFLLNPGKKLRRRGYLLRCRRSGLGARDLFVHRWSC